MSTISFQASSQRNGYMSDASDGQTHCSSWVTTPVQKKGMIQSSQDSRRSLFQKNASSRASSPPPNQSKKQKAIVSDSESDPKEDAEDESEEESELEILSKGKASKKATKKPRGSQSKSARSKTHGSQSKSQSTCATSQSPSATINLTQDSDEENSKVKKKRQRKNPELDDVKSYFTEPFHCDGEVSQSLILFELRLMYVMFLIFEGKG